MTDSHKRHNRNSRSLRTTGSLSRHPHQCRVLCTAMILRTELCPMAFQREQKLNCGLYKFFWILIRGFARLVWGREMRNSGKLVFLSHFEIMNTKLDPINVYWSFSLWNRLFILNNYIQLVRLFSSSEDGLKICENIGLFKIKLPLILFCFSFFHILAYAPPVILLSVSYACAFGKAFKQKSLIWSMDEQIAILFKWYNS